MHHRLVFIAYGWLAASGAMHFLADVVAQYMRGQRAPSAETTLYYGLNSAFSLGQVTFGLFGLWLAWHAMDTLLHPAVRALSLVAAAGWFVIAVTSIEYWQPKVNTAILCALFAAVWFTGRK